MVVFKEFCEICRDDVNYVVKDVEMEGTIKGAKYVYPGREAYCAQCGAEIYVAEINDYNLKSLYDVYRKANGIVSLDVVLAIPEKYDIGKRPLSLLLGWGELTYSRYCDGDVPTKQYSSMLQQIYDDPRFYYQLLESNKCNLKSDKTYEKSKAAVERLLKEKKSDRKIDLVIEYLLSRCGDITPLALQKALYYVQGFYYAFNGSYLFEDDCEAWVHGPVYRDIYYQYRNFHYDVIESKKEFDASVFSFAEKEILDSVIKNICCFSGKILEEFTHSEAPWRETRGDLPANVGSDRVISKDRIGQYFRAVKEKYNMINPGDVRVYAQEMFGLI